MSRSFLLRILRSSSSAVAGAFCLATLLAATGTAHAQGLYNSPTPPAPGTLPTGATPQGVASADFALSGFQSLVVTDKGDSHMKVYLGNGSGTFANAVTYKTCTGPSSVIARDVNNDGYPDIVVACPGVNTIDLFLNNGASAPGTFPATPAPLQAPDPVAMVAGDFLGNGYAGLAVASGGGGFSVLTNPSGNNVVMSTTPTPGTLTAITAGDFNHDGHLDVAVSDSANNNVHVFFGDGTGNFTAAGSYSAGSKPSGIATADFNHDGNLDLAVSNAGSNNVSMLLGSTAGTFTTQANPQAAGIDPTGLTVTDVDSDGNADLIVFDAQNTSSTSQGAYAVLLGNGDGTLQSPQISNLSDVPGTVASVGDLNRDGKPDLAIAQQNSNTVLLLFNNTLPTPYPGGRSFAAGTTVASGNGNMADGIATGDFNRNGQLDVAVTYLEDNAVRVLLNNGGGSFAAAKTYAVGAQPYFVTSGDVNGDGYPDLITVNSSINSATGSISVLLNNGKSGNGTFAVAATYAVGRLPYQVAIGDVNGDGYPDLAVTNYGANTISVLYGSKSGTFTAGPTLTTGVNPYGVVIADFQHDGHPDIAVSCFHDDTLYVFPNNGSGAFGSPYTYSTGSGPMALVAGDFNRDGNLDIVVANATGGPAGDTDPATTGNNVSFFGGNGNGTFKPGVYSPSLNFPQSIAAADLNGDGILDIVGVAPNFNKVEVTLGKGDGTFGTTQQRAQGEFTAVKQPWALAVGDFNNDGQLDIVTANTYNQVNITIPAYQQRYMTQYPPVPGGVASVDLLLNESAANITLAVSPNPVRYNNSGVTLSSSVQPALGGATPTGSVIFEDATGTPLGTGPYALNNGSVSATTGHLGSGQYLFTTLYSGDTNYQPTTASGAQFAVTVQGTPVSLALNPSTVQYAKTFSVSVSVTGTAIPGWPRGTVTVYGTNGTTTFTLGTITLTANGNNGIGTATYTAVSPTLNVGTYQIYGYYASTNGYAAGSSSDEMLTVTPEPTSLGIVCSGGFFSPINCTATVTASTTNTPVPAGNIVNFTFNGADFTTETIGANGQAKVSFSQFFGSYTVVGTFPQQSNYLTSTNKATVFCILCAVRSSPTSASSLNSLSGLESAYPSERAPLLPY